MNEFTARIKAEVQGIDAYHLNEKTARVKLNQNESPYDLPGWLKDEILSEFRKLDWNRYPDFTSSRLTKRLAGHLNVDDARILVGNGSNDLLQLLTSVVLSPLAQLLLVKPTFQIYEQLGKLAGAQIHTVEFNEDWSFPVESIAGQLRNNSVDLAILASPNSPTGATLRSEDLARILGATDGLVLLDEAYYEFCRLDYLKLQNEFQNLVITRTFSKALGLAGLRVGYLIARAELAREIKKAKLPYNLNLFSELVASNLLQHSELVEQSVRKIAEEKGRLERRLSEIAGVKIFPSAGNFFMIETPFPASEVFVRLADRGILVRDVSGNHSRLKKCLRVSVGTAVENDAFIEALKLSLSRGRGNE